MCPSMKQIQSKVLQHQRTGNESMVTCKEFVSATYLMHTHSSSIMPDLDPNRKVTKPHENITHKRAKRPVLTQQVITGTITKSKRV